uniref:Uncharacterized protein n=1 Tax=Arundo donax TaxID=35708 RepID=A0A0A8Z2A6_ARUDO
MFCTMCFESVFSGSSFARYYQLVPFNKYPRGTKFILDTI